MGGRELVRHQITKPTQINRVGGISKARKEKERVAKVAKAKVKAKIGVVEEELVLENCLQFFGFGMIP